MSNQKKEITIDGRPIEVEGVHEVTGGNGKKYYYLRLEGKNKRKRLIVDKGIKEFYKSYDQAKDFFVQQTVQGNLNWLIEEYKNSYEYKNLRPASQKTYNHFIKEISLKFGYLLLDDLNENTIINHVMKWRDEMSDKPAKADGVLKLFCAILQWGKTRVIIKYNHLSDIKRIYKNDRSDMVWGIGEIEQFMSRAYFQLKTAFLMTYFTGQRIGDVLKFQWKDIVRDENTGDSFLCIKQSKTGAKVNIFINEYIKSLLTVIPKVHDTILTNEYGLPWHYPTFNAECPPIYAMKNKLHIHDLRGTFMSDLNQAGLSPAQIAVVSGHASGGGSAVVRGYLAKTITKEMQDAGKKASKEAMVLHEKILDKKGCFTNVLQKKL